MILISNVFKRLLHGMETVEWAIVGVVFVAAAAALGSSVGAAVLNALSVLASTVDP